MTSELTSFTVKVVGRVQGVGYRAWVKKIAKKYELQGWVVNCEDKSVMIEISGKKKNIKMFLIECYKGSTFSNVLNVDASETSFKDFKSFEIRF